MTSYQQLLKLADNLDTPADPNFEVFGGRLSGHTDPSRITSPMWSTQSAADQFAEACRRFPALADVWRTETRMAEQWQTTLAAERARRAARVASGIPEGLA
jgi:hypothetical protein